MKNNEYVENALEIVRQALRPFVQKHLKETYQDRWMMELENASRRVGGHKKYLADPDRWDAQAILSIVWDHWHRVFSSSLGQSERTLISEVREVRNKWAHQETFNNEDTHRALDTMQRLLLALSLNQATDIRRLKDEVLKSLVKEKPVDHAHGNKTPTNQTGQYHVYVNTRRPPGVAMIHYSTCAFANYGDGTQGKPSNPKSYWSTRLGSYNEAEMYSRKARTDIKIRPCKFCKPS